MFENQICPLILDKEIKQVHYLWVGNLLEQVCFALDAIQRAALSLPASMSGQDKLFQNHLAFFRNWIVRVQSCNVRVQSWAVIACEAFVGIFAPEGKIGYTLAAGADLSQDHISFIADRRTHRQWFVPNPGRRR